MVVPITDVVKMTVSVADISVKPIIGTPLVLKVIKVLKSPCKYLKVLVSTLKYTEVHLHM